MFHLIGFTVVLPSLGGLTGNAGLYAQIEIGAGMMVTPLEDMGEPMGVGTLPGCPGLR